MKKILYVVSTLKRCGPINQLSYIIKYLNKSEFEPIILTLSKSLAEDSMESYFVNKLDVKVETLALSRIKGLFFAKQRINDFIKKNSIDLVHSQGIRADALMSDIKILRVATLRNYPFYDYAMTYGKIKGFFMAKFHLYYLKKINEPRVVSKSISKMLKELNNYDIDYVRNGTDIQRFQNLDKSQLRNNLKISQNKIVFVSVGHLNERKDPISIIKAFFRIDIKNLELIFLGSGDLLNDCKDLAKENSNIKFMGNVDNIESYLGASDFLISASLAEGLPNTVLEAMACGLPCLLSNIPPHAEIAEINENSAVIFETKNVNDLINKINKIIQNDYLNMSKASKEIIYQNLSAKIMSEDYQNIYNKLLKDITG